MPPTSRSSSSPTLQPYWKCLFTEAFQQDPTPSIIKHFYLLFSLVAHLPVIFPETFGRWLFHFPASYFNFDETFLPDDCISTACRFANLIRLTTGLSNTSICVCVSITAAAFVALIWTDLTTKRPFRWPKSWETDNFACYHDMFCEPTRENRVIRRPGNALSNFLYLLFSFMILTMTVSHVVIGSDRTEQVPMIYGFLLSDFVFGIMLFILSISSIIWHSCNALWSHPVDLWSMEAVIIYLTFRMIALGVYVMTTKWTGSQNTASSISSTLCFALFVGHTYNNAKRWYNKHTSRFWEDLCPFAVRNRLPNSPYISGVANKRSRNNNATNKIPLNRIGLLEIYLFALLPVSSNVLNWFLVRTTFHTVGSPCLVRILNRSLVFGWTYRLFERWGLDGCRHVFYCEEKIKEAKKSGNSSLEIAWTVTAAVLSPTAALHFSTGVTLIAAFCHSRSTEIFVLSNL